MNFLKQQYPLESSLQKRTIQALVFSGFVFLFLIVFQPFQLGSYKEGLLVIASGYGFICLLVMLLCNVLLFKMLPSFFDENKWNIGRELLWVCVNILLIGLANAYYSSFIFEVSLKWKFILLFEFYTFAVSVIPLGLSVLINYYRLNHKFENQSDEINQLVDQNKKQESHLPKEQFLHLDELLVDIRLLDLLFVQSADNYLELHYVELGNYQKVMIRKTLKSFAEEVAEHENIYQVHRSYIVNLDHVKHISGNAQGLKLHFETCEKLVPVSRKLTDELKNHFAFNHKA